jgi:hypothetical protein
MITALVSTMSWTGCKRLLGNGRGEAEGVTAVQPITVQFLEGQQIGMLFLEILIILISLANLPSRR